MRIKTIRTFIIEYEVPTEEKNRFMSLLAEDEDTSDYEVNQRFLGEKVVHVERDNTRASAGRETPNWPFSR